MLFLRLNFIKILVALPFWCNFGVAIVLARWVLPVNERPRSLARVRVCEDAARIHRTQPPSRSGQCCMRINECFGLLLARRYGVAPPEAPLHRRTVAESIHRLRVARSVAAPARGRGGGPPPPPDKLYATCASSAAHLPMQIDSSHRLTPDTHNAANLMRRSPTPLGCAQIQSYAIFTQNRFSPALNNKMARSKFRIA